MKVEIMDNKSIRCKMSVKDLEDQNFIGIIVGLPSQRYILYKATASGTQYNWIVLRPDSTWNSFVKKSKALMIIDAEYHIFNSAKELYLWLAEGEE